MNERYGSNDAEYLKELRRSLKLRNIDFYSLGKGMFFVAVFSTVLPLWAAFGSMGIVRTLGLILAAAMLLCNIVLAVVLFIEHKAEQRRFALFIKECDAENLYREFCDADSCFEDKLRFGDNHVFVPRRVINIRNVISFNAEDIALHDLIEIHELNIMYIEENKITKRAVARFRPFLSAADRVDFVKELNEKLARKQNI